MYLRSLKGVLIEDGNFSLTCNCFCSQQSMYVLQKDLVPSILRQGELVVPE